MGVWGSRWAAAFAVSLTAVGLSVATAVPASADPDVCAAIGEGRVPSLSARPAHVTFVTAGGYGQVSVTITRCAATGGGAYAQEWAASGTIGRAGFARPGAKREGDGRTPSGIYGLGRGFGTSNPGSPMGYITLNPSSCWGSTVGAATYNTYFEDANCGGADERMWDYASRAYSQGQVIEYNTGLISQGAGSAIFFHVGGGGATAGCVATGYDRVVSMITGTVPGDVIVMGVRSSLISAPPAPEPAPAAPAAPAAPPAPAPPTPTAARTVTPRAVASPTPPPTESPASPSPEASTPSPSPTSAVTATPSSTPTVRASTRALATPSDSAGIPAAVWAAGALVLLAIAATVTAILRRRHVPSTTEESR